MSNKLSQHIIQYQVKLSHISANNAIAQNYGKLFTWFATFQENYLSNRPDDNLVSRPHFDASHVAVTAGCDVSN